MFTTMSSSADDRVGRLSSLWIEATVEEARTGLLHDVPAYIGFGALSDFIGPDEYCETLTLARKMVAPYDRAAEHRSE